MVRSVDHPPDALDPFPNARTHHHNPKSKPFTAATAARLLRGYDLVVDASDNPASRYLLNDACVLAGGGGRGSRIPLVSGAALGTEGQVCVGGFESMNDLGGSGGRMLAASFLTGAGSSLISSFSALRHLHIQVTVYHLEEGGPCYRCIYPTPLAGKLPHAPEGI